MSAPQPHYPATTQYSYPARTYPAITPSAITASGMFGMVVGTSTALAVNLHHVQDDRMTIGQAVADSLAKGAGAGVATAVAVGVARSVGGGSFLNLAVLLGTATGVGYVINSIGKKASTAKAATSEEKAEKTQGGKK